MKIRPLGDRVLVKRIEEVAKTPGGILIPDNAKEKSLEAEVIAVGPGKVLPDGRVREMEVKTGDRILVSKYGGSEIRVEDQDYVILREDDILGIVQ
jgi:chaperonin GroES